MPIPCDARRPVAITHTSAGPLSPRVPVCAGSQPLGDGRDLALVEHVHLQHAAHLRGGGGGADRPGGGGTGFRERHALGDHQIRVTAYPNSAAPIVRPFWSRSHE